MVLYMNHDEVVTFASMESTILGHLLANVNYYKMFHTGDILKDTKMYFKCGVYCDNVLNLIVVATARALKLNLTIYQKGLKGNIQILEHTTHATAKEVHLKFTCDPSNVANNLYEAIFLLSKPTEKHKEEDVTIESPHPSTFKHPINLDDAHDVIDLTDDSEMTTSQQLDSLQYNTSNNELQFPTHLFVDTAAEWVDHLPYNIDGLKLYKIKCSLQEWVQKSQDLRYFKMHSLRKKDLIGTGKVGKCIRNLYCSYDDCPFKLSAEGKRNTTNFQNVDGHKVCFSFENVVSRQWHSVCKVTEYCRESESLTIYHIGAHKCPLKADKNKYRK